MAVSSAELLQAYRAIRSATERLCQRLSPEDAVVQSMPDASPAKWHLAHTTWFFETFVLKRLESNHQPYDRQFGYLFNSYYNAVGQRHPRPSRGLLTRPSLKEVYAYRAEVDKRMRSAVESGVEKAVAAVIELGLHHEQQHQELILTDIKHLFSFNVLEPAYADPSSTESPQVAGGIDWIPFDEDTRWIGHPGDEFCFDNETPRHREFVAGFELADRPVHCGEFIEFIEDGGYSHPEWWLSDGWDAVRSLGWEAPLYWRREGGTWTSFTLSGRRPVHPTEPVCHVSFFEADAFARWAGARLPTEAEWETAAEKSFQPGEFAESERFHPSAATLTAQGTVTQMLGGVWEWTASPYVAYPGYRPLSGALGEYNGKFMCNQMVLRGGSCATPESHIRPTYRNFFPAASRWQFSGFRLARSTSNA